MLYGYFRLPSEIRYLDKDFLIIQSQISQDKKLNSNEIGNIAKKFLELSKTDNKVDLVIWPENAIPIFLSENQDIRLTLMQGIENSKNLLVGDLIIKNESDIYNSAILIAEDGEITSSYDKVHLVPFGEYLPLSKYLTKFNFLKILANDHGLSKGKSYDPISTPLGQARVLICYEIIFSSEVMRSETRPNFIINLSNDAWFDNNSGPYQHFLNAKFRSVENGLPVIRSSNKGISAIIDPYGRVIKRLSLNEEGSIYSRLPEKIPETIYLRYENFIVLALLFLYFLCYRKN
jgi:apolipoprotein N-acyltransferase